MVPFPVELLGWNLNTLHGFSSLIIKYTRRTSHVHSLDHTEIFIRYSYNAHVSTPQHATIFLAARRIEVILIVCLTELSNYCCCQLYRTFVLPIQATPVKDIK